eukprot:CAMPEP_0194127854 /NCGR_PEP_ID=MMETSP0150-20130528/60739_1 /TAXON_ID=122233 /ORGANISM="Chaetoceros debilis, Strain MM31A-1" /LENGTH=704 /DNA_ID=CAMNT_0038821803 /DNA_START=2574 /DNA_END=4688 /DNA_ORIENTATION=-
MTVGEVQPEINNGEKVEHDFLKDCVIRLTKELLSCQHLQQSHQSPDLHQNDHAIDLPGWMLESKVLSPLFTAYDTKIQELSGMIEHQGSVHSLSQENRHLRENINSSSSADFRQTKKEARTSKRLAIEVGPDAQREIYNLKEDNDLLEEQGDLLLKEVEDANCAITARDKIIADLTHEIQSKLDVNQSLQAGGERLKREKSLLEHSLFESLRKVEQSNQDERSLKERIQSLKDLQSEASTKAKISNENKLDLEKRNDEIQKQMIELTVFVQGLENKLASANSDYEKLNTSYMVLARELTAERDKSKRNIQSLTVLKKRLRHEDENEHKCMDAISKLKQVELSRDILDAKVRNLQHELTRILGKHEQLDDVTRQQSLLETITSQHASELEAQDNIISSDKQKLSEQQFTIDRQERHLKDLTAAKENLEANLHAERDTTDNGFDKLAQSLLHANDCLDSEKRKLQHATDEIKSLQSDNSHLTESLSSLSRDLDVLQKEKRYCERIVKEAQTTHRQEMNDLQLQLQSLKAKQEDMELSHTSSITGLKARYESKIAELTLKIEEQTKTQNALTKSINENSQSYDFLVSEYNSEQTILAKCLEDSTSCLRQSKEEATDTISHLQSKCTVLSEGKSRLDIELKQKEREYYSINQELTRMEGKVVSLGLQLSQSLQDSKAIIEKERELKLENHKLTLKLNQSLSEYVACRT